MVTYLTRWVEAIKALASDESGAESSEIILVLVLLVVGLMVAWAFLRNKISAQASHVGNCIGGAATANNC